MRGKIFKWCWFIGILITVVAIAGCSSIKLEKYTYIGLDNTKTLYVTAGQVIADLYKQGKVTENDKIKFIELSRKLKISWDAVQAALSAYVHTKSASDEQKLQTVFSEMQINLAVFNEFYLYLIKGKE